MARERSSATVRGREAQVDICPEDVGFVLSVGRVSIWLERASAEDLVETLGRALLLTAPQPEAGNNGPTEVGPRNEEPN
jgi:hypothetical protein